MCRICVTNRHLVEGDFLFQIQKVLEKDPSLLILREKDLSEAEYEALAEQVKGLCERSESKLVLHSFPQVAGRLGVDAIHMPLAGFLAMRAEEKEQFSIRGVSVHSVSDALLAEKNGATYLTAGHIFATDCKKGVPPRGLPFLKEICHAVRIPVYAIGGIHEENAAMCIAQGAAGVCMMSEFMRL
jgi:thiamine-phosphate pyrophosphorylase